MVDTERFVDDDGNIRWTALLSVGSATLLLGWFSGIIDFITALGGGLKTALAGLGGWFGSIVATITGMPTTIVASGMATIETWLEMLGPLALVGGIIIWGSIGYSVVWALSKTYDRYRGDSG